jgi:branched-chain amino acid transport system substrate-binding protein
MAHQTVDQAVLGFNCNKPIGESSPPKGIAAYKRLVDQEKVFAIFGPAASAVGQALVPTFKASNTPTFVSVFSTPAVTEPPIPILFRTGPMNDRQQGSAMADYVVDHLGAKKVALISQSDEYGKRGGESVASRLSNRKIPLVSNEVFNISDTDFTAQLSRTIQANPDVLIVYGYPNQAAGCVAEGLLRAQARSFSSSSSLS